MSTAKKKVPLQKEARLNPITPVQPIVRKSVKDITVPKRQVNVSAMRFVGISFNHAGGLERLYRN